MYPDGNRPPAVSVIVVNYNGVGVLPGLLQSLQNQSFRDFETVVIDNCSADQSVEYIRGFSKNVKVLVNHQNQGYAKGLNQGIANSQGKFLFLLNNDVELETNVIGELVKFMEAHLDVCVVQPKIISMKDRSYFDYAGAAGGEIDLLCYPFCRGRLFFTVEPDITQYNAPAYVFWASGAAFMVRRDVFDRVGPLDEDFFLYHEETDFCWRVNLAGYRVACDGSCSVYHVGSHTYDSLPSELQYFYMHRNSFYLLFKYHPLGTLIFTLPARFSLEIANSLYAISKGRSREASAIARGTMSAFRHLPHFIAKRPNIRRLTSKDSSNLRVHPKSVVIEYFLAGKTTYNQLFSSS